MRAATRQLRDGIESGKVDAGHNQSKHIWRKVEAPMSLGQGIVSESRW